VLVVQFARDAPRPGFADSEFYFANQAAAPRFIDSCAELALHALELLLPGFAIGGDFQTAVFAAYWSRARSKRLAHYRRPGARKPSECRLRAFKPAQCPSEKIPRPFHWPADSSTTSTGQDDIERITFFVGMGLAENTTGAQGIRKSADEKVRKLKP
jgi:hypothetical protein